MRTARGSSAGSSWPRPCCWSRRPCCSSWRGISSRCIGRGATSRPSPPAATVGGLADWYAVVALFRRPLGLPIPHTAIIPRNHRAHRRQSRQLHRDQFPGARDGREEAGRGRLRRAHGGLARRPRAQRGAGGLRDPDAAQGPGGDRRGRACAGSWPSACRRSFRRSRSRRSPPACWARSPRKASTGACSTSCWACWRSS